MKLQRDQECFINCNIRGLYANERVFIVREKYKNKKGNGRSKYVVDVRDSEGNVICGVSADFIRAKR